MSKAKTKAPENLDFIREIVRDDLASGKHEGVVTRFPPEPNGYLHIGHAKSICLNFGIAAEFGGRCHFRYDDTNPVKEEQEYLDAIERDVRWLGVDWGEHLYHASDYFEQLYEWAVHLIESGKAYVDDLSADEIREHRGTLTEPGRNSPHRDRPVGESLDLFRRMREGEFPDGARVLRARIDMSSGNINLRDPVLYRILHAEHPRTGSKWRIYPTYDFAHGQSDAIEHVTHSLCTLEFEAHRPLYEWLVENLPVPSKPRQIEFARLNLSHTVMSKRVLSGLVKDGLVTGWDDPRMPSLAGLRRRGFPPAAIRTFAGRVGVAKRDSVVEWQMLEHCVREELNKTAPRRMAVLRPIRVVLDNYPEGQVEELDAVNNPEDESAGTRKVPFSRVIYLEREDFMEDPPKKFFRLAPGREVRLRYAYFITCNEVIKNESGEVVELRCSYDPATRGGDAPDGRRVKATLHWVAADTSVPVEVRLYGHLFTSETPGAARELRDDLNPDSLEVLKSARAEPALEEARSGEGIQLERQGYFCVDPDTTPDRVVGIRYRCDRRCIPPGCVARRSNTPGILPPRLLAIRAPRRSRWHRSPCYGPLARPGRTNDEALAHCVGSGAAGDFGRRPGPRERDQGPLRETGREASVLGHRVDSRALRRGADRADSDSSAAVRRGETSGAVRGAPGRRGHSRRDDRRGGERPGSSTRRFGKSRRRGGSPRHGVPGRHRRHGRERR